MISFVTPYWSGREQMTIHLQSIRRFYPLAPILVSKKGGERDEMEAHRVAFAVRYWLEDCRVLDALLRLFRRCDTEYVCVLDHDTVLLSSLDPYVEGLQARRYDLVGVEERIREPPGVEWQRTPSSCGGWLRLAPGHVASNILLFNLREFLARWGLRGVIGHSPGRTKDFELDYGIGQRLTRHTYLLPYHTARYGLGNVLMDGETPVVWHQWYGSYRTRLSMIQDEGLAAAFDARIALVERGERAFLEDYPRLDFSGLTPAWGPGRDVMADGETIARSRPGRLQRIARRARQWRELGIREMGARALNRLERRWLLR